MPPLSEAERQAYEQHGAVFPLRALTADAATALGQTVIEAQQGGSGRFTQECAHMCYRWADALVRNSAMLDAAQSIVGEDILVWETTCAPLPSAALTALRPGPRSASDPRRALLAGAG